MQHFFCFSPTLCSSLYISFLLFNFIIIASTLLPPPLLNISFFLRCGPQQALLIFTHIHTFFSFYSFNYYSYYISSTFQNLSLLLSFIYWFFFLIPLLHHFQSYYFTSLSLSFLTLIFPLSPNLLFLPPFLHHIQFFVLLFLSFHSFFPQSKHFHFYCHSYITHKLMLHLSHSLYLLSYNLNQCLGCSEHYSASAGRLES